MKNFFYTLLVLVPSLLNAAEIDLKIDAKEMLIGDQINAQLTINSDSLNFLWPLAADTLSSKIEIVEQSKIDTIKTNDSVILKQTLTLTTFDTGFFVVKPIVLFNKNKDTIAISNPALLKVNGAELDDNIEIQPATDPLEAEFIFDEIKTIVFWCIGLLILFTAIVLLMIYFTNKKKEKGIPEVNLPADPPHVRAYEKLEVLKKKDLINKGQTKEFHFELSEILRDYILCKFAIAATEMTSTELRYEFEHTICYSNLKEINKYLEYSDITKFTKEDLLKNKEHEFCLKVIEEFIQDTALL